jgi:phosphoglycerate kinase
LLIGGGMAFTFITALGRDIGKSLCEDDYLDFCKKILTDYEEKIILPIDVNTALDTSSNESIHKDIDKIDNNDIGLDIGPKTVDLFMKVLDNSKTVFWNGPLGYYEMATYQEATKKLLEYLVNSNITIILGGGDIVAASSKMGYKDKVTHASTGGGATLEYLEGKELPGLKAIQDKE